MQLLEATPEMQVAYQELTSVPEQQLTTMPGQSKDQQLLILSEIQGM